MGKSFFKNPILTSILSTFVVFALLFSFGLHSLQISHSHPGHGAHHGSSQQEEKNHGGDTLTLGEYMHAAEKKLLFIMMFALLMSAGVVAMLYGSWEQFLLRANLLFEISSRRRKEEVLEVFDYFELLFSRGILHPKLH